MIKHNSLTLKKKVHTKWADPVNILQLRTKCIIERKLFSIWHQYSNTTNNQALTVHKSYMIPFIGMPLQRTVRDVSNSVYPNCNMNFVQNSCTSIMEQKVNMTSSIESPYMQTNQEL